MRPLSNIRVAKRAGVSATIRTSDTTVPGIVQADCAIISTVIRANDPPGTASIMGLITTVVAVELEPDLQGERLEVGRAVIHRIGHNEQTSDEEGTKKKEARERRQRHAVSSDKIDDDVALAAVLYVGCCAVLT